MMAKHIVVITKDGRVQDRRTPISPKNNQFNEDFLQKLIFEEPYLLPSARVILEERGKLLFPFSEENDVFMVARASMTCSGLFFNVVKEDFDPI